MTVILFICELEIPEYGSEKTVFCQNSEIKI